MQFAVCTQKMYILSPLSFNPDLPPFMGRTSFTKWKDQGIVSFKQVLKEGTLKSFSELKNLFDIDNKDFYKYLQLRHLINNILAKGHIS